MAYGKGGNYGKGGGKGIRTYDIDNSNYSKGKGGKKGK